MSLSISGLNAIAGNIAACDLTAVTHSSSLSVSVAAEAVQAVNEYLCGDSESAPEEAPAYALALAESFVNAVVNTTASCYAGARLAELYGMLHDMPGHITGWLVPRAVLWCR